MDITKAKYDEGRGDAGVWIDYDEDTSFRIASVESKVYKKTVRQESEKHPPGLLKRRPDLAEDVVKVAMSIACIKDWRGVRDGDTELPCTVQNRIMVMRAVPELADWIATQCHTAANFRAEALAEDAEALKSIA